jgi:hypothetical protein
MDRIRPEIPDFFGPDPPGSEADYDLTDVHRDPGPRTLVIHPLDVEGGERIELRHSGANDPEVATVALRYRDKMSDPNLPAPDRKALGIQIWRDVAALKSARAVPPDPPVRVPAPVPTTPPVRDPFVGSGPGPTAGPSTEPRAPAPPDPAPAPAPRRTPITFDFGELGSHTAAYDHAQVADRVVLLAARVGSDSGYYAPPPERTVVVTIAGYPAPLPVMLVGVLTFNGFHQVILFVVDPS